MILTHVSADIIFAPTTQPREPEKKIGILLAAYLPYFFVPFLLLVRMLVDTEPFAYARIASMTPAAKKKKQ